MDMQNPPRSVADAAVEATLDTYDHIVVAFSGGKDSMACLLRLLDLGVPRERIELWHHDIDGREGSTLMDWPCTRDYCRKVADALGVRLFFSWRIGGFEREMCRDNQPTERCAFEDPDGTIHYAGGSGSPGTRLKFPQVSADLSVRWCSAYLKIDVARRVLANSARFRNARTLFVTGERAEESKGRAGYKAFEPHVTDNRDGRTRRHIDAWRPVHQWPEQHVWDVMQRWRINPHPAYHLGWGRVSCAACIFGNAAQFASLRAVNPAQLEMVAAFEDRWGVTIKRNTSLRVLADSGTAYDAIKPDMVRLALSETFDAPVFVADWRLPAGAFGDACGPT